MNYPTFLKKVDAIVAQCDKDKLSAFVHELARTLPENQRERFLSVLDKFYNSPECAHDERKEDNDFAKEIDIILEKLEKIQNGEHRLGSEYNPEWRYWSDEWNEEYNFSDSNNVVGDVKKAVNLLHQCLDHEEYKKGAILASRLSELRISISGDYDEGSMGISTFYSWGFLMKSSSEVLKEAVSLAFMGSEEGNQAEAVLTIMDNFEDYSITLEDILETAKNEINLSSFLPSWIKALTQRESYRTDKLLLEAINMLDDNSLLLDIASKNASSHPTIYLGILRTGLENVTAAQMLEIGLKAMEKIPVELPARSDVCLLTASFAIKEERPMLVENCWMEAFKTTPSVVNYLRLRFLVKDWSKYAKSARSIYDSYYHSRRSWSDEALPALMFFDGRFGEVIEQFMNPDSGIGWSFTFMKQGIALFLMLLSNNAEGKGMEDMIDLVIKAISFDGDEFCLGTKLSVNISDSILFLDCFEKWREKVPIDDELYDMWIRKIYGWIALRVSAIMKANKRNYYEECAAFIAALGEVEESRGKHGSKELIMQKYKALYPYRRAFIDKLVRYGMSRW